MRVAVLGSGSAGNCLVVESAGRRILIDAGFSCREIEARCRRVGIAPETLEAVVVTHEHNDHSLGADRLARRFGLSIYATEGTLKALTWSRDARPRLHAIAAGWPYEIAGFEVESFSVPARRQRSGGPGGRRSRRGARRHRDRPRLLEPSRRRAPPGRRPAGARGQPRPRDAAPRPVPVGAQAARGEPARPSLQRAGGRGAAGAGLRSAALGGPLPSVAHQQRAGARRRRRSARRSSGPGRRRASLSPSSPSPEAGWRSVSEGDRHGLSAPRDARSAGQGDRAGAGALRVRRGARGARRQELRDRACRAPTPSRPASVWRACARSCSRTRWSRTTRSRSKDRARSTEGRDREVRRRHLPGHQLRPRRVPRARARGAAGPSPSGTARPTCSAATWWSCRAGSPTATTCAPARWPRCRRSWTRSRPRRGRRPGARHLQRLPDPARSRASCRARCGATGRCASSARTCTCASSATDLPFTRHYREGQILAHADRPRRGQLHRQRPALDALEAAGRVVFRYVDERGEIERRRQRQRLVAIDRGDHQRRRQRARHDAAPGALRRGDPRQPRRPGAVRSRPSRRRSR